MGKHRWPTAGDEGAQPPEVSGFPPHDESRPNRGRGGESTQEQLGFRRSSVLPRPASGSPSRRGRQDEGPSRSGVQWGVARPAALVFLGVALAIGGALSLVRSSEPSAAAVSVQLDAESANGEDPDTDQPGAPGPGGTDAGAGSGGTQPDSEPQGQQGDVQRRVGDASDGSTGGASAETSAGAPAPAGGDAQGTIVVYVTGAVAVPGVVTIRSGTRLVEVLEKAGGALPEADLEGINLAATPSDGQHIHLLAVGEEPRADEGVPDAPTATSGVQARAPDGTPDSSGPSAGPGGVIDINTATLAEIESLPRVGPVVGQRIIDWREEHGPFGQPADIDAIPGIGPAMLEGILPLIVVR